MESIATNETITSVVTSAQMIDQLTAKGVMFVMLMFMLFVCYMLFRWIFSYINSMQEQIRFNEKIEINMEKIANSVSQSLDFLKEDLKEQKAHNEALRTQLTSNASLFTAEIKELESRLYRILRSNGIKGIRDEL
ncbi:MULTISPECIES: hypothetical protein [Helicobacter]|uniref:hypothetical protein n=1 Tax=Helicobacter TaxID=209 RepID=UPI00261F880E|nr:hypothetical protein [Helicobacter sp. UBA3407]